MYFLLAQLTAPASTLAAASKIQTFWHHWPFLQTERASPRYTYYLFHSYPFPDQMTYRLPLELHFSRTAKSLLFEPPISMLPLPAAFAILKVMALELRFVMKFEILQSWPMEVHIWLNRFSAIYHQYLRPYLDMRRMSRHPCRYWI